MDNQQLDFINSIESSSTTIERIESKKDSNN